MTNLSLCLKGQSNPAASGVNLNIQPGKKVRSVELPYFTELPYLKKSLTTKTHRITVFQQNKAKTLFTLKMILTRDEFKAGFYLKYKIRKKVKNQSLLKWGSS